MSLCTANSPVKLRTKLGAGLLRTDACALVIVGDHDWLRRPRPDDPTQVVEHREVEVEAYLLPMMTTVACDPQGKNDRTGREVEHLGAVELQNVGGVFMLALSWYYARLLLRIRIGSCRPNTCGNLARNALRLMLV